MIRTARAHASRVQQRRIAVAIATVLSVGWGLGQTTDPPPPAGFVPGAGLDWANVGSLELAWAAALGFDGRVVGPPAFANGRLYVSTDQGVTAIAAADGTTVWTYRDPAATSVPASLQRAPRGAPVLHSELVIVSLPTRPAVAGIDAGSGEVRWIQDVGGDVTGAVLSSNPTRAGDVVVVGPTGADLAPTPGRLVAIDPTDGTLAWEVDLVPLDEDDPARSSWAPVAPSPGFGVGGGTAWNVGAYDEVHDLVIFGTGQPIPTDRLDPRRYEESEPSTDLYTASFVAVDAGSGDIAWFHQVVPGDEWEYDQHTVPVIADLELDGASRRVAILATTTGFVVTVDVATGELLRHHRMVPFSTVHLGYAPDGTPIIDPAARRTRTDETVRVCPGARWASVAPGAFRPASGLLYRPNEWSCVRRGATDAPDTWEPGSRALWLQSDARSDEDFFGRWGALTAIDPITGEVAWEFTTPYRHDSGVIVTDTGLVVSAFADRTIRIFAADSGEMLWSYVAPAHSDATPLLFDLGGVPHLAVLVGRDVGVPALPASGLPPSVAGSASLFVFRAR